MRSLRAALIIGETTNVGPCLSLMGFRTIVAPTVDSARETLGRSVPALVVVDVPDSQATALRFREVCPRRTPIFFLSDSGAPSDAVVRSGSGIHVLSRPLNPDEFEAALRNSVQDFNSGTTPPRESAPRLVRDYAPLLGQSAKMVAVKHLVEKVAQTNATILLRGETGTGKDVVARAVHAASGRHDRPFLKVNCASLPAELLESELFGHEKGAFTGADRRQLGKFEFANHGTIFLDEIGELALTLQAKLLHVLDDFQFSRIGGREIVVVDTRIIAATNRDLESAVAHGHFREDLFYRLSVVEIHVPPLRERRDEILELAAFFLDKFNRQYGRHACLSPSLANLFREYEWPGNVRELENAVRRLAVLSQPEHIEAEIRARRRAMLATKQTIATPTEPLLGQESQVHAGSDDEEGLLGVGRRAALEAERKALTDVLYRVQWNRLEAARILKVSYKTLLAKIVECGLSPGSLHKS